MGKKASPEALTTGRYGNGKGHAAVEEDDVDSIYCGVGQCRPRFMQGCANITCMTMALCLAGLSTSTLNIYISSQITTLERQFGFSSSISGILLSCNDFGYLLTTLPMAYVARRVHIPRALSVSTLLFGLSGLLCTVPFFATRGDIPPVSEVTSAGNASLGHGGLLARLLCKTPYSSFDQALVGVSMGGNSSETAGWRDNSCEGDRKESAISAGGRELAIAFIAVGMILQGFGKSPRQPFIGTYIDDNVPKTKTTLYLGIVACISVFGPVLAFTLGGLFSRQYLTLEETNMTPRDPRWVGAWWLGFLAFGLLGVLSSIPTFFFPRRLKPQPQLRKLEQDRKQAAAESRTYDFKEFLKTMLRLLRTPVYMCVLLGSCMALFGVSGMIAFIPKYMETQFLIPAWQANIMVGVLNILAAAGGTLTGGIVTSRFKLSPRMCLKLIVAMTTVSSLLVCTGFFLGCDQPHISMGASSGQSPDAMTCQMTCHCDNSRFFPVCGADDVTYFSPCHAGCSESHGMSYGSCSCINATMTSWGDNSTGSRLPEARPGFCTSACNMLYPFALMNFFGAFAATVVMMPCFIVSVRSVSESDKPLAIGFSAFMSTLLGWFLSPIVYGRVIDTCCMLWSSGCDGSGSCILYNLTAFRNRYHALFFATRVGCALLYTLALVIATVKRVQFSPHRDDDDVIQSTLQPEVENLVLEESGNSGNGSGKEDEEMFMGGKSIFKGNNRA